MEIREKRKVAKHVKIDQTLIKEGTPQLSGEIEILEGLLSWRRTILPLTWSLTKGWLTTIY